MPSRKTQARKSQKFGSWTRHQVRKHFAVHRGDNCRFDCSCSLPNSHSFPPRCLPLRDATCGCWFGKAGHAIPGGIAMVMGITQESRAPVQMFGCPEWPLMIFPYSSLLSLDDPSLSDWPTVTLWPASSQCCGWITSVDHHCACAFVASPSCL